MLVKIRIKPSEIEPASFRYVAYFFNQLRHRVPPQQNVKFEYFYIGETNYRDNYMSLLTYYVALKILLKSTKS